LSPNDEQTFRDVVVFYLKAKQPDRAMQKLNAVSDAAKQAFHYELMGMVAEQSGKPQDSENAYKEALKKDPNRLNTETLLFNQYLHSGRFDDALQRLDVLEKKIPAGGVVPSMRGAIKEAQGHLKEAEDYYRQALQIDSTNDLAANNLAYILAQEGRDLTAALGWAQGVRQRQPQDPAAADTLGWVFYKLDRLVQARNQLQFAASMQPENAIFQYHLGEIYKKNSQNAEALKALKKAVASPMNFKEKGLAEASLKDIQKLASAR